MTEHGSVRVRPFNAVFITAAAWAGMFGLFATALLLIVGAGDEPVLFWSVVGATGGLAFLRAAYRVRLEVDGQEIRVFNVRKTYRISWDAVRKIDVVAWWLSPSVIIIGNAAVRVSTRSGERIVIDASTREASTVLNVLTRFGGDGIDVQPG